MRIVVHRWIQHEIPHDELDAYPDHADFVHRALIEYGKRSDCGPQLHVLVGFQLFLTSLYIISLTLIGSQLPK